MVEIAKEDGTVVVRLFFDDLRDDVKEAILRTLDIDSEDEMNWDVFPIAEVIFNSD